jgi:hypothetical protein
MARQWRRVWIIERRGKSATTFQVVYYDWRRCQRTYDRSFQVKRLAKEYAGKLELFINGTGPIRGSMPRRRKKIPARTWCDDPGRKRPEPGWSPAPPDQRPGGPTASCCPDKRPVHRTVR